MAAPGGRDQDGADTDGVVRRPTGGAFQRGGKRLKGYRDPSSDDPQGFRPAFHIHCETVRSGSRSPTPCLGLRRRAGELSRNYRPRRSAPRGQPPSADPERSDGESSRDPFGVMPDLIRVSRAEGKAGSVSARSEGRRRVLAAVGRSGPYRAPASRRSGRFPTKIGRISRCGRTLRPGECALATSHRHRPSSGAARMDPSLAHALHWTPAFVGSRTSRQSPTRASCRWLRLGAPALPCYRHARGVRRPPPRHG